MIKKENYEKEYGEINEQIAGTGYARLEEQLKSLEENLSLLERSKNKWDGICARLNGWEDVDIVSNQILWDIEKFKEGTITGEEIERLKRSLVEVQKEAEKDRQEASSEIRSMNKEADVLEKELTELKLGKKAYPRELELARSEIARKLSEQTGKNIQVRIFADLIDIKDETWRNAIEGYLSWNKLALIVEPAYVKQAMEVYETLDEKRFFRVSLVDTEKLMQEDWRVKDNALAEEVEAKEMSLDDVVTYIAKVVADRAAQGHNFGTVLIPEGLVEFIPAMKRLIAELNDFLAANAEEFGQIKKSHQRDYIIRKLSPENSAIYASLPEGVARQLTLDRDPHGNVQVSLIETEKLLSEMVATKLAAWKEEGKYVGKFASQHHFFGYEGRCAAPSNFDADYCYSLGYTASMLIANGKTGYMSSVRNTTAPAAEWIAGGVPITMMMNMERRHGEMKPVIQKALVKLDGAPFKAFASQRERWAIETDYVYPGPIQYFGPTEVCDQATKTLQLEQAK